MALKSMTGFARREGAHGDVRWHWEVRSVNGRGLDIRLRLPPGQDSLEARLKDIATKRLARGNVSATLTLQRDAGGVGVRLNKPVLDGVLSALAVVRAAGDFDKPRPESILAMRGVLEFDEASDDEATIEARNNAMAESFADALGGLIEARAAEGLRLAPVLGDHVAAIERIVAAVTVAPGRQPEAIRARIGEQIRKLTDAAPALDPERLHQEALLVATRIDVEEELKRLTAHVEQARALFADPAPVGRKLDFLAQEFNREANTLCSKANDIETTRLGLELKAVIDQMREQVQNIE